MPNNLLLISPYVPAPHNHGMGVQVFNLIKGLADRNRISLVALLHPADKESRIEKLKRFCHRVELIAFDHRLRESFSFGAASLSPTPRVIRYLWPGQFTDKIKEVIRRDNIDIVQVELLPSREFIDAYTDIPAVVHHVDVLSNTARSAYDDAGLWRKPLMFREWRKMLAYERDVSGRYQAHITCSDTEAKSLAFLKSVRVIPHGVDTNYFNRVIINESKSPSLLFLGAFMHSPNVRGMLWFIENIWPGLKKEVSDVRLTIIGHNPPRALKRMANDSDITVTGSVPDIRPYLEKAWIFISPLTWGGGMKIKMLEAMASGQAIVTTPIGAEGLAGESGKHYLVAESAEGFSEALLRLIHSKIDREKLRQAARELAIAEYSWERVVPKYDEVYNQIKSR